MKGRVYPRPYINEPDPRNPERTVRRPIRGKSTWTYTFAVKRGGKRHEVSQGGYRTKPEARGRSERGDRGAERRSDCGAVEDGVQRLPDHRVAPATAGSRKPSTYHGYEFIVEKRIVPELGDLRLAEITGGEIAKFLTSLRSKGGRRDAEGKELGLSERSLKNTFTVLHSTLDHAVEAGLLPRTPRHDSRRQHGPHPDGRTCTRGRLTNSVRSRFDERRTTSPGIRARGDEWTATIRGSRAALARRRPRRRHDCRHTRARGSGLRSQRR